MSLICFFFFTNQEKKKKKKELTCFLSIWWASLIEEQERFDVCHFNFGCGDACAFTDCSTLILHHHWLLLSNSYSSLINGIVHTIRKKTELKNKDSLAYFLEFLGIHNEGSFIEVLRWGIKDLRWRCRCSSHFLRI